MLQGLHHSWLPLARYCRQLESFLGHPAQANAYFTPRGSQGLPVHHDTHEVLSLQVAGEKRWLVYEPVLELPLKSQRYRSALGAPGSPVLDVTLRAGDTLYLPRGWLHQALTSDSDSLHITVGVNVRTWLDEARIALESCANDVDFRRAATGDEAPALPELDPDTAAARARRRLVRTRRPILDGQLSELRALDSLDLETELVRRDTVIADLEGTTLSFEGRELRFPAARRDGARVPGDDGAAVPPVGAARVARRRRPAGARQEARARGLPASRSSATYRFGRLSRSVEHVRWVGSPSSRRTSTA